MATEIVDKESYISPRTTTKPGQQRATAPSPPTPSRGVKRQRQSNADDDDDDDDKGGRERRKIEIKFIQDKSRRHITFSKRKAWQRKRLVDLGLVHHVRLTVRPQA